jgi:hypothetical protein
MSTLAALIADTTEVGAFLEATRMVGINARAFQTMLMDIQKHVDAIGTDAAACTMWQYLEAQALRENIDGRHLPEDERNRVQNILTQLGAKTPLGRALLESDIAHSATLRWTISQRSLALRSKGD